MKYGAIYPSLENKTVLVTGGGSGIGESIVRHFVNQKSKVGFIDKMQTVGGVLCTELKQAGRTVHFESCDITETQNLKLAVENIRKELGPITILINNAAHDERHILEEVTPEYWDERFAVNIKHQFFAAQAVVNDMKKLGGGSIINMGSTSWMIGQGGMAGYTAAKSAVLGLTRSLARDLGEFNIRVNSIAPGWIMTQRQIDLWLTEEAEKDLMKRQCLKRKLYPDDIARTILFFASDEAGACTNQSYVVDGGWI